MKQHLFSGFARAKQVDCGTWKNNLSGDHQPDFGNFENLLNNPKKSNNTTTKNKK